MFKVSFCNPDGGAFLYIINGLKNALEAIGIPCQKWDGKPNSIRSFNPTVYIGATGWRQELPPDIKHKVQRVIQSTLGFF